MVDNLLKDYASDDEAAEPAPDVDISLLQNMSAITALTSVDQGNTLMTKPNHLTGYLDKVHVAPHKFHEEYHKFENQGKAMAPEGVEVEATYVN